MSTEKEWNQLCVSLHDLLQKMEIVAAEVCPINVPKINSLSALASESMKQDNQTNSGCEVANGGESGVRKRKIKKKKAELPALPRGLSWPNDEDLKISREGGEDLLGYLRRKWGPLIVAGYGELRWMRQINPAAVEAIDKYERTTKTRAARRIPEGLRPLTEKEANDRRLEENPELVRNDPKMAANLAYRLKKQASRAPH